MVRLFEKIDYYPGESSKRLTATHRSMMVSIPLNFFKKVETGYNKVFKFH